MSADTLLANTVIVKGYVKDSANHAVANKTVLIYNNDSLHQGCLIAHSVVTNPNGYFTDTLSCNADIKKLLIVIENCNGQHITRDPAVSSTNIVEVSFVICSATPSTPPSCKAVWQSTLTTAGVKFTSNLSQAPAGDSIISRHWVFGDSTELNGNQTDPTHAYSKAGDYNVCLTIKTKNGCENRYCGTVEYRPANTQCFAYVHANVERSSILKFRFTSNTASTTAGDSIIGRTWKFGDGTTLGGNEVNPIKEYKDTGVYNVCVIVKTARGCEASHCFTVVARDTAVHSTSCKAYFTTQVKDSVVYFNSEGSKAGDGDSIISRTWYYTDATVGTLTLGGNVVDTFIKYTKPGSYNVYLVIKTKNGCESKFSGTVVIPQPPVVCRLQTVFTAEKISALKFRFNSSQSSASGDSIVKRIWKFGDNTGLEGNEISPLKEYKDTGVYNVCLTIKSKSGCEKQYCMTLVVRDSVPRPTNCKACFTVSYKDSTVYFNSSCSAAPDGDSIISRTWYYVDSTLNAPLVLTGNVVDTFIRYTKPGTYTVYLAIKTKKGCESKSAGTVVIPPRPVSTACKAFFEAGVQQFTAKFNSAASKAGDVDSIISRTWIFGDSSQPLSNNVDPSHTYQKPGTYDVYLYIKTKGGCESKYTLKVVITAPTTACNAMAQFAVTRISAKKVQFNSIQSTAQHGDSIIQRRWKFGDGTAADGNEISPVKEYAQPGVYNACLQIKTANGCENQICKQVNLQDTSGLQSSVDFVKIISINPNPVVTRMLATIWSRNTDTEVEISIYDIYGTNKMTIKKKLGQGNNIIEISVANLYHGPYFLRVSSKNGHDSKAFYKL